MKSLIIILAVAVLAVAGYFILAPKSSAPTVETAPQNSENTPAVAGAVVEITAQGFSPDAITVKAGETVIFANKDSKPHWPASAAHPTHAVYPGSGMEKCGTAEQSKIFDACKGLKAQETFVFQFNEKGSWKYHDHLNPVAPFFGTVNVE